MEIKHLVLSGGGNAGFVFFGIIKKLIESEQLVIHKLESIYATSVGCFIGTCLALGFDMETLEDFLVKRPWKELFSWDIKRIFHCFEHGGFYSSEITTTILAPLLLAKDLSIDITLAEFYEWNHIDFHLFTTEFMTMKICDISYKTHPTWKLRDVIYASCCLPLLFVPYCPNTTEVYIDGGAMVNYPLDYCISAGNKPDEILGLHHHSIRENNQILATNPFQTNSSYKLIDFLYSFLFKLWYKVRISTVNTIPYEIEVKCENVSIPEILRVFESQEKRSNLVESGEKQAMVFLEQLK
jgi:predicted acylesterase/phospholipase RssA